MLFKKKPTIRKRKFGLRTWVFLGITTLLLPIALYAFLQPKSSRATWFDPSWKYRQAVNINNTGTSQTNFLIQVILNTEVLIDAGQMQSDCDDARFATASGTSLSFFTEGVCDDTNTIFWVQVGTIPSATSQIYFYYGNESASSASSYIAPSTNNINIGNGADGAITISSDTDINTATSISGRSCADGGDAVNYSVTENRSAGTNQIVLASTPSSGCLAVGDEVLIINLQGTRAANSDVGEYETARITTISTATLTLNHNLTNGYDGSTQKIMVQRVPNYTNVTVSTAGTDFSASDWNGTKGGVMMFRANGTVTVDASTTINANTDGYTGGTGSGSTGGENGESYDGSGANTIGRGGDGSGSTSCGGDTVTGGFGCRGGGNSSVASGTSSPNNGAARGGGGGSGEAGNGTSAFGNAGAGGGGGYGGGGGGGGGNLGPNSTAGTGGTGGSTGVAGGGGGGACGSTTVTQVGNGGNAGSAGTSATCNGSGTGGQVGSGATSGSGGGGPNNGAWASAGGGGGGFYGTSALTTLFLGSGGGGGGVANRSGGSTVTGTTGSDAGGIVVVTANTLSVSGNIQSNGGDATAAATGGGSGGAGSGGSVLVQGITSTLGSSLVTASGGARSNAGTRIAGAGAGGVGRIQATYSTVSGSTSPSANESQVPVVQTVGAEEEYKNPVGFWKFDEGTDNTCPGGSNDACDRTGNGKDLAKTNAVWQSEEFCVDGKCAFYDGSGDFFSLADDDDFDFTASQSFSISGWFRHGEIATNADYIVAKHNATAGGYKVYMDSDGDLFCGIDDDSTWGPDAATNTTDANYDDNNWHYFSCVKNGTTSLTLYVDAVQVNQNASISGVGSLANANTLYVGIDGDGSSNGWQGFLDEVKIYNYARSEAEVKTGFLKGATGRGSAQVLGAQDTSFLNDGLVGYWPMDERTENTCTGGTNDFCDASGNGQDLSMPSTTDFSASGKFAYGLSQTGENTDDYAALASFNGISSTKRWTIAGWVKTSDTNAYFIDTRTSNANGVGLYTDGASTLGMFVDYSGGSAEKEYTYSVSITDGNWHHLLLTRDGDNSVRLFFDGALTTPSITTDSDISSNSDTWSSVTYANRHSFDTYILDGSIDEARIYNRSFSPTEALAMYTWAPGPDRYFMLDNKVSGDAQTLFDSSGNSGNATSVDGANNTGMDCNVIGKFGGACNFDGVDDYIDASNISTLTTISHFTVGFWVNPTTLGTQDGIISQWTSDGSSSTSNIFAMRTQNASSDEAFIFIGDGSDPGGNYFETSNLDLSAGTWQYLTIVYDGNASTRLKLYKNGVEVSGSYTGTIPTTSNTGTSTSFTLARTLNTASQNYFDGKMDDIRIYTYPRSSQQIVEDMNAGHPTGGSPVGTATSYWKFDEMNGTTAFDANATNANNLTLSSASWTTSGKYNGAWNGTGSVWASRADDADFDFGSAQDFSLSIWAKSDSANNPAANQFLIDKQSPTNNPGYRMYFNTSGQIVCEIDDDTSSFPEDSATTTTDYYDATWHHIVCIRDNTGTDLNLYVDGNLAVADTSLSATGDLSNADSLWIGDDDGDSTNSFAGDIDEVKIFRSALTADQVKIVYSANSAINFGTGTDEKSTTYGGPGGNPPIRHWSFDENKDNSCSGGTNDVCDRSGNNDNGAFAGNATWGTGKIGSAISLDGSGDYAALAISTVPNSANAYTISTWINPTILTGFQVIFCDDGGNHICFTTDGNSIEICTDGSTCSNDATSNTNILATNTWQHVVVTHNGSGTFAFYVNGVNQTLDATATVGSNQNEVHWIGADHNNGGYFTGKIDEMKIFDYALSQAQISYEYNGGAPTSWYKLDDCTGTTAYNNAKAGSGAATGVNGTITIGATGGNTSAGNCSSGTGTEAWNNGTTGKRNASLDLDGTDDYISVSTPGLPTGDFTYAFWVNMDVANGTLLMSANSAGSNEFQISVNGANVLLLIVDAGSADATTTQTIPTGEWVHIAATRSSGNLTVYVNGVSAATGSDSTVLDFSNGGSFCNFYIGTDADACTGTLGEYLDGQIDDVRIYRYGLSAKEILKVMNEGAVRFGPNEGSP